jgi:hypothetical protein
MVKSDSTHHGFATNATESLQVAVEDYQNGSRPHLLSAVRNKTKMIHKAGIIFS